MERGQTTLNRYTFAQAIQNNPDARPIFHSDRGFQYIKEVSITDNEYKELCQWVQSGNSPYNNGWDIATDAGTPMDYIKAKRIVESQIDSAKKNNPF